MSYWDRVLSIFSTRNHQLKRIADALDRAFPPVPDLAAPADEKDVTYASDEATAVQEIKDEFERYRAAKEDETV